MVKSANVPPTIEKGGCAHVSENTPSSTQHGWMDGRVRERVKKCRGGGREEALYGHGWRKTKGVVHEGTLSPKSKTRRRRRRSDLARREEAHYPALFSLCSAARDTFTLAQMQKMQQIPMLLLFPTLAW